MQEFFYINGWYRGHTSIDGMESIPWQGRVTRFATARVTQGQGFARGNIVRPVRGQD